MTKLYKLTDATGKTYNGTQWGENVTHSGTGKGQLCGPGWIHAYESPYLAALLNSIHADFDKPLLWEAEGKIAIRDGQLKCGCKSLTTLKQIPLPKLTTNQRIYFAIQCALAVCKKPAFSKWAEDWLTGKDRSAEAARAAAWAVEAAWAAAAAAWAAAAARAAPNLDLIALAKEAYKWKG